MVKHSKICFGSSHCFLISGQFTTDVNALEASGKYTTTFVTLMFIHKSAEFYAVLNYTTAHCSVCVFIRVNYKRVFLLVTRGNILFPHAGHEATSF